MWLLNGYGTLVLFSYPQISLETVKYCDVCTFDWLIDFLAGEKFSCHLHLHLLKNGLGKWWEILMFAHLTGCCTFFKKENPSWLLISCLYFHSLIFIFVSLITTIEKLSNNTTFIWTLFITLTSAFTEKFPEKTVKDCDVCAADWLTFLPKKNSPNHRPSIWITFAVLVLLSLWSLLLCRECHNDYQNIERCVLL